MTHALAPSSSPSSRLAHGLGIDGGPTAGDTLARTRTRRARCSKGDGDLDCSGSYTPKGERRACDRSAALTADWLRLPPVWRAHAALSGIGRRLTKDQRTTLRDRLRAIPAPTVAALDTAAAAGLVRLLAHAAGVRDTYRPHAPRAGWTFQYCPPSTDDVAGALAVRWHAERAAGDKLAPFPFATMVRTAKRRAERSAGRGSTGKGNARIWPDTDRVDRAAAVLSGPPARVTLGALAAAFRSAGERVLARAVIGRARGRILTAPQRAMLSKHRERVAMLIRGAH